MLALALLLPACDTDCSDPGRINSTYAAFHTVLNVAGSGVPADTGDGGDTGDTGDDAAKTEDDGGQARATAYDSITYDVFVNGWSNWKITWAEGTGKLNVTAADAKERMGDPGDVTGQTFTWSGDLTAAEDNCNAFDLTVKDGQFTTSDETAHIFSYTAALVWQGEGMAGTYTYSDTFTSDEGGGSLTNARGEVILVVGWVAGFIPALLVLVGVWFYLARRTGKQVETIAKAAMAHMQEGRMAAARDTLRSALPLGKWQVLVESQLYGQIGAIDYLEACSLVMQRQVTASKPKFTEAKVSLLKSWSRDWRSRTMLAVVYHRENNTDEAVKVLKAAQSSGSGESIFWAVYVYVLNEAKRRDEALQVVARGLAALPKQASLLALQDALSNRRRPEFKSFGEPWYQFFPDQIPQEVLIEQARAAGKLPPQAANRSMKTWPQPRR